MFDLRVRRARSHLPPLARRGRIASSDAIRVRGLAPHTRFRDRGQRPLIRRFAPPSPTRRALRNFGGIISESELIRDKRPWLSAMSVR